MANLQNAYTLVKKGPQNLVVYTQLQNRNVRSGFTVVTKSGMGSSSHVKSRA